jgi:DNA polymerase-3 subunit epsilon
MKFAIIDLETTGGSLKNTHITEFAIFIHDGDKVIDEFCSLVNPECEIPHFITRLTGINNVMVKDAPKFFEVAKDIVTFTEDAIFVAHNVGYDYNVLRKEFKSLGYDYRRPHLCTVRSARYILPGHQSYSLGKIAADLKIEINGRHRAGGDALATAELFKIIYKKVNGNLSRFIQLDVNPRELHPNLNFETLESLPSKIGIYKFKNERDEIIYIGKSKNIKKRVEQHLKNNTSKKALKMKEEITKISYNLTGSEVIALLLESELIKRHQPRFNRQLRKYRFHFGLYSYHDHRGYINLFSDRIKNQQVTPITTFTTKAESNRFLDFQSEKHQLCKKLVSRYPTKDVCFQFHTKECQGACIGEEDVDQYNFRVSKLLEKLSFEEKSFYIIEKGRRDNEVGLIHIENGTYIGYGFALKSELSDYKDEWKHLIKYKIEDKDDRRILQSYISKNDGRNIVWLDV